MKTLTPSQKALRKVIQDLKWVENQDNPQELDDALEAIKPIFYFYIAHGGEFDPMCLFNGIPDPTKKPILKIR